MATMRSGTHCRSCLWAGVWLGLSICRVVKACNSPFESSTLSGRAQVCERQNGRRSESRPTLVEMSPTGGIGRADRDHVGGSDQRSIRELHRAMNEADEQRSVLGGMLEDHERLLYTVRIVLNQFEPGLFYSSDQSV